MVVGHRDGWAWPQSVRRHIATLKLAMERQQPGSGSGDKGKADPGLQNFRFTFTATPGPHGFIEPDPEPEPAWESSESLSESVQDFPEEFGRTYHAYRAGSYAFPNDIVEQERLELQGNAMRILFGDRLFFAPFSESTPPRAILDVATGVGDWAIQMGDLFPSARVIATDLSPIQPEQVPPNVSFYVEDSSDPWEYSQTFDYVHTRAVSGCWSSFEKQVAQQAFAALEPGGWFESQEVDSTIGCDDGTLDPEGPMATWFRDFTAAGESCDRSIVVGATLKDVYERVGFVDVQERIFKIPTNGWAKNETLKELGRMWERNLLQGLSGFSFSMFNRVFGWTPEQTEVALVNVRRELSDMRIHAYMPVYVVWGRKPFPGEGPIRTPNFQ
ncbi:hypothetical protein TOPH_05690 [Tolypocladium ophioglossoides CBS 100239]|uniref:Uncharacterized protein n=1 Tax=Tolypocladium ophioglossoides (strain CBS 100239) TaxID=1163406 RepID=A0A0L0N693_TOLOC|nr:hypothetical protein TOPH_05690 [Tolypocladium ophioglossoides CBS 100239]